MTGMWAVECAVVSCPNFGKILSPTSRVRSSVVVLLLNIRRWILWLRDVVGWHALHTEFRQSRTSDSESTLMGLPTGHPELLSLFQEAYTNLIEEYTDTIFHVINCTCL
jgi:hypothetical protein